MPDPGRLEFIEWSLPNDAPGVFGRDAPTRVRLGKPGQDALVERLCGALSHS